MSKLNIQPLADRVVIEPLPAETTTAGGLIIPDYNKKELLLLWEKVQKIPQ